VKGYDKVGDRFRKHSRFRYESYSSTKVV